jgi:hypothetical protein
MLKATERTLTAAALIAAASAPSTAYARPNLDPDTPAAPHRAQLATVTPARPPRPSRPARPVAESSSASRGFAWGDAGLGAARTLVLLGTGAGSAAILSRRRGHQARVS